MTQPAPPLFQQRRERRKMLGAGLAAAAGALTGCDRLSHDERVVDVLRSAETLTRGTQRALGRRAMAQEFTAADIAPTFRPNGTTHPAGATYAAMLANGFADWRLRVEGLVLHPASFSLAELQAMPARTQITRHDCVEGWSCIGQWKGVRLSHLLRQVGLATGARYVMFHCLDRMEENDTSLYYESVDLDDALHEQTILAWELNGQPLPVANGAPLRARIERQLGYKQPKYLHRIEVVSRLAAHGDGRGGYWEDRGYNWYAGI